MLKGWEARADEYLFKPFHPDELVTRIRSLLAMIEERRKMAAMVERKNKAMEYANNIQAASSSVKDIISMMSGI